MKDISTLGRPAVSEERRSEYRSPRACQAAEELLHDVDALAPMGGVDHQADDAVGRQVSGQRAGPRDGIREVVQDAL